MCMELYMCMELIGNYYVTFIYKLWKWWYMCEVFSLEFSVCCRQAGSVFRFRERLSAATDGISKENFCLFWFCLFPILFSSFVLTPCSKSLRQKRFLLFLVSFIGIWDEVFFAFTHHQITVESEQQSIFLKPAEQLRQPFLEVIVPDQIVLVTFFSSKLKITSSLKRTTY